jgi:hypothetical protein
VPRSVTFRSVPRVDHGNSRCRLAETATLRPDVYHACREPCQNSGEHNRNLRSDGQPPPRHMLWKAPQDMGGRDTPDRDEKRGEPLSRMGEGQGEGPPLIIGAQRSRCACLPQRQALIRRSAPPSPIREKGSGAVVPAPFFIPAPYTTRIIAPPHPRGAAIRKAKPLVGMGAAPAAGFAPRTREASGTALGVLRPLCEELAGTVDGITPSPHAGVDATTR